MTSRRTFLLQTVPALALGSLGSLPLARAQDQANWPSRPIRIISTTQAGGGADNVIRAFADYLQRHAKHNAIIENKPGAAASIAAVAVKNSKPDGYTFLQASVSISSANPALYTNLNYDPAKDFVDVGMFGFFPYIAIVRKESPYRSAADLIAAAKANPGKLKVGYSAAGSQVPSELLKIRAGVDILSVPYKAAPQVSMDIAAGNVDFAILDGISAAPTIRGGLVRAIAVTSAARSPYFPELPALSEMLPGFSYEGWVGLAAPAGTPSAILERMNEIARLSLTDSAMLKSMEMLALSPRPMTLAQMAQFTEADRKHWVELIQATKIPRVKL